MRIQHRRLRAPKAGVRLAAAGCVTAAFALAACGDSDSDTASTAAGATAAATATTTGTTAAPASDPGVFAGNPNAGVSLEDAVATGLAYTGGTAGKADASKEPIGIGWLNEDTGGSALPGLGRNVDAAVQFINDNLGGIGGRPLEVIQPAPCKLGGAAQNGTLCAQALLNDDAVDLVLQGFAITGEGPFMSTFGKNTEKPLIGAIPSTPADEKAAAASYVGSGSFGVTGSSVAYISETLKAKKTAQIWPSDPTNRPSAERVLKALTDAGVETKNVFIPPQATDVLAPITASQPKAQDVIGVNSYSESQCLAAAKALTQLGITDDPPIMGNSTCLTTNLKEQLGDFPKWIYGGTASDPNVKDPRGEVGAQMVALERYHPGTAAEDLTTYDATAVFGSVMAAAKYLNELGDAEIDLAGLQPIIRADTGPVWGGPDKLEWTDGDSIGTRAGIFSKYLGDGNWEYVSGWVG